MFYNVQSEEYDGFQSFALSQWTFMVNLTGPYLALLGLTWPYLALLSLT